MDILSVFRMALADRRHGATDVERQLITGLLEYRTTWDRELLRQGALLIQTRSSMANLRHLAETFNEAPNLDEIEHRLLKRQGVLDCLDELLADAGHELVMPRSVVVTISRSSAVEAVLVGAFNRGWRGRVIVLDGTSSGCRPAQADRYSRAGLEVCSLPDGAMMGALAEPSVKSLVLAGADAVGPHRIVNAQGTGLLLNTALRRSIDTAVVADTGKDVGEGVIKDVLNAGPVFTEAGPGRAWPVFEAFSRDLVRERISERGWTASGEDRC